MARVAREAAVLVSYGGDQRHVLASIRDSALVATEYDGEARFQRDRAGRIVAFVYYRVWGEVGGGEEGCSASPREGVGTSP